MRVQKEILEGVSKRAGKVRDGAPGEGKHAVSLFILGPSRSGMTTMEQLVGSVGCVKRGYENPIADNAVRRTMGFDERIGPKFLRAGPGYGGSCFPKDTLALMQMAQTYQSPMRIVEAVTFVNEQRKRAMGRKVIAACGGSVRNRPIAILGLTFKPNTDDMRDAPSLSIIQTLQDAGARIKAYDPVGMDNAKSLLNDVSYAESPYACAEGAHALVIVTEWDAFSALNLDRIRAAMFRPLIVDLRNIYSRDEVERSRFTYVSIGQSEHPMELAVQVDVERVA